jgi:hypothetical protein
MPRQKLPLSGGKTTGGKVELSKCFYCPIIWQFDNDGNATIQDPDHTSSTITLVDIITKQNTPIESKSCNDAHKTLGVMACQAVHRVSTSQNSNA